MYDRDKKVENAETLERLLIAIERLTELVSKEESSKAILDSLKDKGAKDVKTVPTSDVRADDIKINRPSSSSGRAASGVADINYSTINRLNTAFRALQGDLGAFQKTLMNSVVWGNKAQALATKVAGYSAEQISPIKTYKQAERWYLDKMEKGEGGLAGAYKSLGDRLAPDGEKLFEFLKQGFDPKSAGKVLTQRNKEALIAEAQRATTGPVVKPGTPGASGAAAIMGGLDMGTLARVAGTVALAAAPLVMTKLAMAGTDGQIADTRSRFGTLNGSIATTLAHYDMSQLTNDLNMAPKISKSFKALLESREDFNKTLQPIDILAENVKNTLLTGLNKLANVVMKPFSWVADALNKGGEEFDANQKKFEMLNEKDKLAVKMGWMPLGWANVVANVDAQREKTQAEMDDLTVKTPMGLLALEIKRTPICPPRRFVP